MTKRTLVLLALTATTGSAVAACGSAPAQAPLPPPLSAPVATDRPSVSTRSGGSTGSGTLPSVTTSSRAPSGTGGAPASRAAVPGSVSSGPSSSGPGAAASGSAVAAPPYPVGHRAPWAILLAPEKPARSSHEKAPVHLPAAQAATDTGRQSAEVRTAVERQPARILAGPRQRALSEASEKLSLQALTAPPALPNTTERTKPDDPTDDPTPVVVQLTEPAPAPREATAILAQRLRPARTAAPRPAAHRSVPTPAPTPSPTATAFLIPSPAPTQTRGPVVLRAADEPLAGRPTANRPAARPKVPDGAGWAIPGLALPPVPAATHQAGRTVTPAFRAALRASRTARPDAGARPADLRRWSHTLQMAAKAAPNRHLAGELRLLSKYAAELARTSPDRRSALAGHRPRIMRAATHLRVELPRLAGVHLLD